ncbi:MAG TPA: hypothetical protein VN180_06575, partial [Acidimicrobiia bacterium]|nr:hypothetical protein [Acidimicrobiia bacterium]
MLIGREERMLGWVRRARARGGRSPVLVALLGAACAASLVAALVAPLSGAGADGTTRDPFLWPFATTSPWNVPVGSGARFASDADPRTLDLQAVPGVNIDAQAYSQPMYRASTSDPLRTVTDPHGTAQYRIPDAATPAAGTDADLHVVDPTDHWVDECWNARRLPSGDLTCGYHVRTDLTGSGVTSGVRAAGVSAIGGLIRQWELDQGQIDHAVALALPDTAQAGGPIWPATAQDSDAVVAYRGHIPLGTLLAIPSSVDVTTLGLTPGGLVLAHALQDFGAYDVDSTGEGVPGALYADPSA